MAEWYAIYTKFQHEKSAARVLEKKEFEVFLPVYRTVHRWKDRNQILTLPLFPCYLFLRTDLNRKADVMRTAGVRFIVENAGRACAVPNEELESVRKICKANLQVQPHAFLKQGELVRVRKGPLAGTEGFFVRLKNEYRIVVTVGLLKQSVAAEIDLADVELDRGIRSSPLIPSLLSA
jgi:transcription antitermination factor NusG